ncbi:small nuclear ribonucleoprotein [Vairimorpha necatrix]|uniref:Small nuclear ribonucleoprotein n=1 Tax=Vairimorpha necatrix TaxID=6039 RepID=A0AAX4JDJ7_9MICR
MDDKFINYRVKVHTKDKAFVEGTLIRIDKYRNILLEDSEEFRKGYLKNPREYLGLIIIPGANIKYIEYLYKQKK